MSQNISTTTRKKVGISFSIYATIHTYFQGWCETRIINQTLSLRYYKSVSVEISNKLSENLDELNILDLWEILLLCLSQECHLRGLWL